MKEIRFFNRELGEIQAEQVYGSGWMQLFYGNPVRSRFTGALLANKIVSGIYGAYKSSERSARSIPSFIEDFSIPIHEYEDAEYRSFNDFFIRRFAPSARHFASNPHELSAFAEARYLAFSQVEESTKLPIKGVELEVEELLGEHEEARKFLGGPAFIARLCPVDYHRFHYPCDGHEVARYRLHGRLHSVNPLSLTQVKRVFSTNERVVTIMNTPEFGRLAYIEVGALCVGKIVQSHTEAQFRRGDEKGYFLFGGSTVILLGEPGSFMPDADLLKHTQEGLETLVKLGTRIASKV